MALLEKLSQLGEPWEVLYKFVREDDRIAVDNALKSHNTIAIEHQLGTKDPKSFYGRLLIDDGGLLSYEGGFVRIYDRTSSCEIRSGNFREARKITLELAARILLIEINSSSY
jgi:hypothetical protein